MNASDWYTRLCLVVVLPAILAHEGTHWLTANTLGAQRATISLTPRPAVRIAWSDLHSWRVRLTGIAPTAIGLVGAAVWIGLDLWLPATLPTATIVAVYWLLYTVPSREDVAPLRYGRRDHA